VTGYGNCRTGDTGQSAVQGDEAIRKRVIYTGPVDHEKMYLYYNAADLCIIPSYYESFCLTALESVSCGTPVLATGVGEIPEISRLSDLCKIMPDNRPETLAAYIYESLENNVADVPRPGAGLLTKYGWDSIAARVMHEYYSVLKAPVEVA
jgi:D-inositol-3-phosphate glycosyltransferase